jgi:hypothetical protein
MDRRRTEHRMRRTDRIDRVAFWLFYLGTLYLAVRLLPWVIQRWGSG